MAMNRYRSGRYWAVYDEEEKMVCLCVYKKGAIEVSRRLGLIADPPIDPSQENDPKTKPSTTDTFYPRRK